jgi:hypothetical protein
MKKNVLLVFFLFTCLYASSQSSSKNREYYQLQVFHFRTNAQEAMIDEFLSRAFLPAMHRQSIAQVGVFKPIGNDTASDKLIYVLLPLKTAGQFSNITSALLKDKNYVQAAKQWNELPPTNPPYVRLETIFMQAFRLAPRMKLPALKSPKNQRVYELRSYESATEALYRNKVKMFNEGGEIALFARLQFNAIFYAEVLAGSRMPHLMYLTSFENMEERNRHWKTFVDDPEWKKLSSMPEYQNNVSKADIILMRAAEYSDY